MDEPVIKQPKPASVGSQVRTECEAMARYALSSGLSVPAALIRTLDAVCGTEGGQKPSPALPAGASAPLSTDEVAQLAQVHGQLAAIIAPAIPRTVVLLENEAAKRGVWAFLGPVPLVRRMMLAALLSLLALITIGLSPDVNEETVRLSLLQSDGLTLLLNMLFLMAASSLGATFAALFRANRYVTAGTFDPKYEASYWMLYVLGLIAGIILAELLPLGDAPGSETITKPTLAIVGGFSAAVVYRMLNRLVETVETLVRGRGEEVVAARELAARVRVEGMLLQGRSRLAANLMHVRQQVGAAADPQEVLTQLDRILADVAPSDFSGAEPGGDAAGKGGGGTPPGGE